MPPTNTPAEDDFASAITAAALSREWACLLGSPCPHLRRGRAERVPYSARAAKEDGR